MRYPEVGRAGRGGETMPLPDGGNATMPRESPVGSSRDDEQELALSSRSHSGRVTPGAGKLRPKGRIPHGQGAPFLRFTLDQPTRRASARRFSLARINSRTYSLAPPKRAKPEATQAASDESTTPQERADDVV